MNIQQDISLKPYNTFGIDVKAAHFVSVSSEASLIEVLSSEEFPDRFILGGGSNMLLTKDIDKLVIHVNLKGITVIDENDDYVTLKVSAGENWHQFVLWCIDHNYGGIENLSLIPGNVGTAPIQNIGAYGVELKDVFVNCEAINIESKNKELFDLSACEFGYRDSIFKRKAKGKYIITSVTFRLTKKDHKLNISYGAIEAKLNEQGVNEPTIKAVSDAVISIRQSKLPDPAVLGNSGSFFKNPVIDKQAFEKLKETYPKAPHYVLGENEIKVPAGWLIETAGFKGKRYGDAGVHKNQALVLVNHGDASGAEIWQLAQRIRQKVKKCFGIDIEAEVNVL